MKKIFSLFLVLTLFFGFPACAKPFKKMSQLEIREIQTHVYPTSNHNNVFKAVINTLQDDGYTIINIEDELGYIWAKKEYKAKRTDKKRATFYSIMLAASIASAATGGGANSAKSITDSSLRLKNELEPKTVVVNVNANVDSFGKQTKVRLAMVEKVLYNADGYSYVKSSPRDVMRIYNNIIYNQFFSAVDKNIFYENI